MCEFRGRFSFGEGLWCWGLGGVGIKRGIVLDVRLGIEIGMANLVD